MVSAASENLMVAADTARKLHAIGPGDTAPPATPATLEQVLAAIGDFASAVKDDFAVLHQQLAESKAREQALLERVAALEARIVERDKANADRHNDLMAKLESILSEAQSLGMAAASARSESIHAADRAEAAERYVKDATFEIRSERQSEPAIPGLRKTQPGDPIFESDYPPPEPT